MDKERFDALAIEFFKALKEKTLLIIIDSASKNDKAVFSLVSFKHKNDCGGGFLDYSNMLEELGFKHYGNHDDLFITYCAGRFSLFILDNIGSELRRRGIKLPRNYNDWIQYQNRI